VTHRIEAAFRAACADEIAALKPGNVHVHAAGHGMTIDDFVRSCEAAAPALCARGARLGTRVLDAVQATRRAVGQNTNLGIVLLCAPLAMAAESDAALQQGVRAAIASAGVDDAGDVFAAIVLAAPGGLGDAAQHDVRRPATVRLAEAMQAAASRDRIALQYVTGFADVFGDGVAAYRRALERWGDPTWAAAAAYLRHLAAAPDSHVARKFGGEMAAEVQNQAVAAERRFLASADPNEVAPDLLAWDTELKRRGINPGTCADMTVATIMVCRLQGVLPAQLEGG
jgi:triphosphoribosyl-dephospho-CoA synthase